VANFAAWQKHKTHEERDPLFSGSTDQGFQGP
jgi:hypothetical protein